MEAILIEYPHGKKTAVSSSAASTTAAAAPPKYVCLLKCKSCDKRFSPGNPSDTSKEHMRSCAGPSIFERARSEHSSDVVTVDGGDGKYGPVISKTIDWPDEQRELFLNSLAHWAVRSGVSFKSLGDPLLQEAMAVVSMKLPGEKVFRTTRLMTLVDNVEAGNVLILKEMEVSFRQPRVRGCSLGDARGMLTMQNACAAACTPLRPHVRRSGTS
jgi:hypothetical protein